MPKVLRAKFITSAANFKGLPKPEGAEICVLGRSNVGKSSFINHVLSDHGLARVSRRPGKTALANFYSVNDGTTWVDLPGYGYAEASRGEKGRWSELIRSYCENRPALVGAIWLLDIRHPGTAMDLEAHAWLTALRLPLLIVLTKGDKISRNLQGKQKASYARIFGLESPPVVYSTMDAASRARFADAYEEWKKGIPSLSGRE